jgi:hypothetical protein
MLYPIPPATFAIVRTPYRRPYDAPIAARAGELVRERAAQRAHTHDGDVSIGDALLSGGSEARQQQLAVVAGECIGHAGMVSVC